MALDNQTWSIRVAWGRDETEVADLEPISKLPEEHGDAGQLHKAQEIGGVVLPADEQPPLPLQPGKEALDKPASFVPPEMPAILCLEFAGRAMRRNAVHALLFEVVIEPLAVIGPIPNEMFGLGFEHVEVETELDQGDCVMIRCVRTDGEGEPMPIHNRQNLHAFPAFREPHGLAAALGGRKRGVDETLAFINRPVLAQGVGQLGEDRPQHFPLTPLLESTMDSFVVGIALGQEVPLGAGVENPEDGFQNRSGRHRFAPRTGVRNVCFRKVFANPLPLVIT